MFWGQLGGRREESSLISASCFAGLAAGLYLGLETIVVLVVLVVLVVVHPLPSDRDGPAGLVPACKLQVVRSG